MSFTRQIVKASGQPSSVRVGTVVSLNPLQVQVQDTVFSDLGILGSYFPVVGDPAVLLGQSNEAGTDPTSWLVLGSPSQDLNGIQSGQVTLSFGPATSATQLITFAHPFNGAPNVFTNIASGAGATAGWISRGITVNAADFTLFVSGASATWVSVPVQWMAVPRNQ